MRHPVARSGLQGRPSVGRCRRCGRPVIGCTTATGAVVAVDPRPIAGGELLINPSTDRIVAVRNPREATRARHNGDAGFVPHDRICPAKRDALPAGGGSCVARSAS